MAGRFLALDGLRGLLALYVLAGHTVPFLDLPPAFAGLASVFSHGRAAVALFFVLSGLVIPASVQRVSQLSQPMLRFLLTRAGRLLPVYALALTLAAFALSLGDPFQTMRWLPPNSAAHDILETGWPEQWLWHLGTHALLLHGLLPSALLPDAAFTILGPAWSLSTEWQFYALTALALAAFDTRLMTPANLRRAVIALLLTSLLGLGNGSLPGAWQFGRAFLPQEAWYFALGIASFALLRAPDDNATRRVFAATLLVSCMMSMQGVNSAAVLVPLIWALCLACQNPALAPPWAQAGLRLGQRLLISPLMLWAGRLSYPLYLTHAPVQRLLMLWLSPRADGDWSHFTLSFLGPAVALPLLVALALHRTVEEPCRRWTHRRAMREEPLRFRRPVYASGSNTSAAGRP